MMKYFHHTNRGNQIPEANQMPSYFRTEHDYHQYRLPDGRFSSSSHPEPQGGQRLAPSSSFPRLEYFGPKDYVPESPYLLQGGQQSPGVFSFEDKFQGGLPAVKKPFLEKLVPKPRLLFKRSVEHSDTPYETIESRLTLRDIIQSFLQDRTDRGLKKPRKGGKKDKRLQDRCQKCNGKSFAEKKEQFCKNVCNIKNIQKDNCKLCKSKRYRNDNPGTCSKCKGITSTTSTTTTTTTTTEAPARSLIMQKRKCRAERSNSDQCVKLLDKCNSRSFRATHSGIFL